MRKYKRRKNPSGWAVLGWVVLGLVLVPPVIMAVTASKIISDQERLMREGRRTITTIRNRQVSQLDPWR